MTTTNQTVENGNESPDNDTLAHDVYESFYYGPRWVTVSEVDAFHASGEAMTEYLTDVIELAADDKLMGESPRSMDELIETIGSPPSQ